MHHNMLMFFYFLHKKLDSLLMGEEYASSLGVNIKMLRLKLLFLPVYYQELAQPLLDQSDLLD